MNNSKPKLINQMVGNISHDLIGKVKTNCYQLNSSSADMKILNKSFNQAKSFSLVMRMEEGDILYTDTHRQAKEIGDKYEESFGYNPFKQIASLKKMIYSYIPELFDPEKDVDVNIPSNIEKKLDKVPPNELFKFAKELEKRDEDDMNMKTPKQIALENNFCDEIHHLCKETFRFYDPESSFNKLNQILTVKYLAKAVQPNNIARFDEGMFNSYSTQELCMEYAHTEVDKMVRHSMNTDGEDFEETPEWIREMMKTTRDFFYDFSLKNKHNTQFLKKFNSDQSQLNPKMIRRFIGYKKFNREYSHMKNWDMEKVEKTVNDLIGRRIKSGNLSVGYIHAEKQIIPFMRFAVHFIKYGGRVRKVTPENDKHRYNEVIKVENTHHNMYDMFDFAYDDDIEAVEVADAEFDEKDLKWMFRRWEKAQQSGVTLQNDLTYDVFEDDKEVNKFDIDMITVNLSTKRNYTIRKSCYRNLFDTEGMTSDKIKYLRLLQMKNIILDKIENHDEKIGVIAPKKAFDNIFKDIPDENTLHFGNMKGSNNMEEVDELWVVGSFRPSRDDLKEIVERRYGDPVPSIKELSEKYGISEMAFFEGTKIKGKEADGHAHFKLPIEIEADHGIDISKEHKKVLMEYRKVWDMTVLEKIRQGIGRKRIKDSGRIIRVGIMHPKIYEDMFDDEHIKKTGANSFINDEIKKCPMILDDIKDDFDDILWKGKNFDRKIEGIPHSVRVPIEGQRNARSGSTNLKTKKRPSGYKKKNMKYCMKSRGYDKSQIRRELRMSKKDYENL